MKRFLALLMTLVLLSAPALAEPEEMAAAFAEEMLPEYLFMDAGGCGALLPQMSML